MKRNTVFSCRNLQIVFPWKNTPVPLVNRISFHIDHDEIVGLVGESGSGKSLTAFAILRLLPTNLQMSAEEMRLNESDLLNLPETEMQQIRGKRVSMIFQDPFSALNPLLPLKVQLEEVLKYHTSLTKEERYGKMIEVLQMLDFPDPQEKLRQYPHQLSGGLNQRMVIAMALITEPDLIIADEPTTALDVTTQAYTLYLLQHIQQKKKNSILFISHDLLLLSKLADRIYVMYRGEMVEEAAARSIFNQPAHPYTQGLIDAIPLPSVQKEIKPIPGMIPPPSADRRGCVFADRCFRVQPECRKTSPPWQKTKYGRVRCFFPLR